MCGVNRVEGSYAETLERWSDGLAAGQIDNLLGEIAVGSSADVERFLLNNGEERRRMLHEELALVALACDNFADLVTRYLREVPRVTYDEEFNDSQRFLRWLSRAKQLSPRERDFVAYQEAEYACLALARNERAAHMNFQRQLAAPQINFTADGSEVVCLNPIRVYSRLAVLNSTNTPEAAEAVFFAVGTQIRFAGLAGPRADWLQSLAAGAPCSLQAWASRCPDTTLATLVDFVRELNVAGLVAVTSEKEFV